MGKREIQAKELRKMLKDPAGRKLASDIVREFLEQEEQQQPNRLKIAILMPSYKEPHSACLENLHEAIRFASQFHDVFMMPRRGGAIIHWCRNFLISDLLNSGQPFDYVLFIDNDMVLGREHIVRLVGHGKDIVVPLCVGRYDPPRPVISKKNEDWSFHPVIEWKDKSKDLHKVDAAGTGIMLISKKAIMGVAALWMNCSYEKAMMREQLRGVFPNETEEEITKVVEAAYDAVTPMRIKRWEAERYGQWFDFLPHYKHQHGQYGEDISFCLKATMAGFDIWCDSSLWPGHIGDYPFTFEDFIAYRELARPEDKHDANGHHQPGGLDDGTPRGEAGGLETPAASADSKAVPGEAILVEGEDSLVL